MAERTCIWPDCTTPWLAQKYCSNHYQQARRTGLIVTVDAEWHRITGADPDRLTGVCSRCGEVEIRMILTKGRRTPTCYPRLLEVRAAKRQREVGTEAYNAYHRDYTRRRKYGLPKGGIEQLVEAAGHQCAICECPVTIESARIDHDHSCCSDDRQTCGECVRGVLCNSCNSGIGLLRDDPAILRAAISYLESSRVSR